MVASQTNLPLRTCRKTLKFFGCYQKNAKYIMFISVKSLLQENFLNCMKSLYNGAISMKHIFRYIRFQLKENSYTIKMFFCKQKSSTSYWVFVATSKIHRTYKTKEHTQKREKLFEEEPNNLFNLEAKKKWMVVGLR